MMMMKRLIMICCLAAWCVAAVAADSPVPMSQAECRRLALANNEQVTQADNELRRAQLEKEIAFTSYLPKIDGMASAVYMVPDLDMMGMELQMRGMYMAGLTLTQPLYTGGKIRTGNKLARIGVECAEQNNRKTRMQVIADADNAYWTYISVRSKVKMLETYGAQMDTLLGQVETAVRAGMGTENDLLRISTKRSEITYQLQKARNGADLCRLALCNVTGLPFESMIIPTDTAISVAEPAAMDGDISMRPELALLQKQVEAGEQQVKIARADMLPSVALSAGYTYYGNVKLNGMNVDAQGNYIPFTQKFQDGIGLIMASVSIPILHWGENTKKVKKAKIELHNAQLDLQRNTRLLGIEARQAMQNVADGYNMVLTARQGCMQADENLRVMNEKYRASMCTLTDLLDAQSQWQQSQSNRIEAVTQYKIYQTEYLRTTGRLGE